MPTATFTPFYDFSEQSWKGVHDFSSDTFKVALTNSAPDKTANANISDITEIAAVGGYSLGGYTLDGVTLTQASNVSTVTIDDEVITASGASVGPFRYAVIQNSSASGALVGFLDYGSASTLADTESLTLDFNPTSGVLTNTVPL